ncbi:arsenate reductase ArsC, partial [Chlorobium phaeovibrioides]
SGQHPKDIATYLGKTFVHYLLIVCSKANDTCPRIWPGMAVEENRIYWPIEDPAATEGSEEERLEAFRRVRDELQANLADWIEKA